MSSRSLFEQMGGESALRPVVDRFVDRVFDDVMIGFFFRNASRERVKEKEYELAAAQLGAGTPYTGKNLREAHAPHPIMGGQFNRRLQILRETLAEFGVPEAAQAAWVAHTEALRSTVTRAQGSECDPVRAGTPGVTGAGSR